MVISIVNRIRIRGVVETAIFVLFITFLSYTNVVKADLNNNEKIKPPKGYDLQNPNPNAVEYLGYKGFLKAKRYLLLKLNEDIPGRINFGGYRRNIFQSTKFLSASTSKGRSLGRSLGESQSAAQGRQLRRRKKKRKRRRRGRKRRQKCRKRSRKRKCRRRRRRSGARSMFRCCKRRGVPMLCMAHCPARRGSPMGRFRTKCGEFYPTILLCYRRGR